MPLTVASDMFCKKSGNEDVAETHSCKGKKLWRRVKYQLVEYHSLPAYLKDNEFILRHYRSEWPLKQAFLSIFTIHNETLNVWTHLIGFFIFLFLTIYTAMKVPDVVDFRSLKRFPDMIMGTDRVLHLPLPKCFPCLPDMPHFGRLTDASFGKTPSSYSSGERTVFNQTDRLLMNGSGGEVGDEMARPITRWPFFAFMGGAMFCLLASSTCHLLSCHSERLSYVMLRLDYAGIAALIATSFYPPVYYSFMCRPLFCALYLGSITAFGVVAAAFSLLPVFQDPKFRTFRASVFFGMGAFGAAPILHKLVLHHHHPEAVLTTAYEVLMGTLYAAGALVYATRVPERWRPGRFDIAGHSHQLFHVLVVLGAFTHYCTGLVYLRWRDFEGC